LPDDGRKECILGQYSHTLALLSSAMQGIYTRPTHPSSSQASRSHRVCS
jgi:hypothetical protein